MIFFAYVIPNCPDLKVIEFFISRWGSSLLLSSGLCFSENIWINVLYFKHGIPMLNQKAHRKVSEIFHVIFVVRLLLLLARRSLFVFCIAIFHPPRKHIRAGEGGRKILAYDICPASLPACERVSASMFIRNAFVTRYFHTHHRRSMFMLVDTAVSTDEP